MLKSKVCPLPVPETHDRMTDMAQIRKLEAGGSGGPPAAQGKRRDRRDDVDSKAEEELVSTDNTPTLSLLPPFSFLFVLTLHRIAVAKYDC
jgi:hypothetical protein